MSQVYGDKFAKVYNIMWSNFAESVAPILLEFYRDRCNTSNKYVLDLCCGTGQLARYFLKEGYYVIGIDLSEGMLYYAQENNREFIEGGKARFIKADACNFTIDEEVGLVVSTYDAINHIKDIESLRNCFISVYRALIESGYFIFDLNTRFGLKNSWNSLNFIDRGNIVLLNRGIYDEENNVAVTRITGFIQNEDELYERFDEVVYNIGYDLNEVKSLLEESGFRDVYFAKLRDLGNPILDPEKEYRIFTVAKK